MTWISFVVAVVTTGSIVTDSLPDNPCDVLGRRGLVHIAGRCFYISPPSDNRTFHHAQRFCHSTRGPGRLAIPRTEEIRQDLLWHSNDGQRRWVGMQPITNGSDFSLAKWVDNTSAQEVYDAAPQYERGVPLPNPVVPLTSLKTSTPNVLSASVTKEITTRVTLKTRKATGKDDISTTTMGVNMRPTSSNKDRITTREFPQITLESHTTVGVSSNSVTIVPDGRSPPGAEEMTDGSTDGPIPQWIIFMVSAIAAGLVIGATVVLCACFRRRSKRKSARNLGRAMPPSVRELESRAGELLPPQNRIQLTDNHPALIHLPEAPSSGMYAAQRTTRRENQYSDASIDKEEVVEKGVSAPKAVFKVRETERKGDVYAEVNMAEKRKYRDAADNTSESDYCTTLVENTIYGE